MTFSRELSKLGQSNLVNFRIMGSCTAGASTTSTVIPGRSSGWTRTISRRPDGRLHQSSRKAGGRTTDQVKCGVAMSQSILFLITSVGFSFIAWGIVVAWYVWPELRGRSRAEAMRPLLVLHSFRFVGLSFLVPGVVSPNLPAAWAGPAGYGDLIAAILALLALAG